MRAVKRDVQVEAVSLIPAALTREANKLAHEGYWKLIKDIGE